MELLKWAGIEMKPTSTHRPSSNGQVERVNQEIKAVILKSVEDEEDWDASLAACLWALRIRPSRRTGVTPYQIIFGITPRIPFMAQPENEVEAKVLDDETWKNSLKKRAESRRHGMSIWKENMRGYEQGRKRHEWKENDWALLRNFGRKKMEPRWRGPYRVVGETAHSIKLKTDAGRDIIANKSDVKPYRVKEQQARAAVVEERAVPVETYGDISHIVELRD